MAYKEGIIKTKNYLLQFEHLLIMTKQNFLELAKQNLQGFYWPAWFPYPSSWFRALILVPIALPGTHLIVWGLTGIIISFVENRPLLLSFSLWFGIFLPTVFLAFLYHFIWYIWQRRNSKNTLSKLIPSCSSIWQGFYTTFVLALSFIIIVALFTELTFLECKYSQIAKSLNICNKYLTERTIKSIFSSIENKKFFVQPWFIIWIFNVSYLFQLELLFKKILNNQLKLIWKNKYKFNKNDAVRLENTDLPNDKQDNKNKKHQRQILEASQKYYNKSKNNKLVKLIFNLLAIGGTGLFLFTKVPLIKNNLSLYISSPNISSKITFNPDVFQQAGNKAISTANLAQSTIPEKEWKKVIIQWQAATSLMKTVPPANPNDATGQQRITKYKKKLRSTKRCSEGSVIKGSDGVQVQCVRNKWVPKL